MRGAWGAGSSLQSPVFIFPGLPAGVGRRDGVKCTCRECRNCLIRYEVSKTKQSGALDIKYIRNHLHDVGGCFIGKTDHRERPPESRGRCQTKKRKAVPCVWHVVDSSGALVFLSSSPGGNATEHPHREKEALNRNKQHSTPHIDQMRRPPRGTTISHIGNPAKKASH